MYVSWMKFKFVSGSVNASFPSFSNMCVCAFAVSLITVRLHTITQCLACRPPLGCVSSVIDSYPYLSLLLVDTTDVDRPRRLIQSVKEALDSFFCVPKLIDGMQSLALAAHILPVSLSTRIFRISALSQATTAPTAVPLPMCHARNVDI